MFEAYAKAMRYHVTKNHHSFGRMGCFLLLMLVMPPTLSAEIYRWIDADGKAHYSDRPGPAETRVVDIPDANVAAPIPEKPAQPKTLPAQTAAEESSINKKEAAKRCAAAQERLTFLEQRIPNRIMITGEDGKPARMTVERWESEKIKARERIAEHCR